MVHLRLLGPVHVVQEQSEPDRGGKPAPALRFRSRRTIALLGYLAVERRPKAREYLATFFWPDEEPAKGRSNLRRELYNLAQLLPDCWQTDPQTVTFSPAAGTSVDIDMIIQLQNERRWQDAAELLTGEFLEGINLPDNIRFENWLLAEREQWQERSLRILNNVCDELAQLGRFVDALPYAWSLLQLTPWDEKTHQQLMRLLAWTGQRETALRQFAACRQALTDELGIEPAAETIALYEQITVGALEPPPTPPAFLAAAADNRHEAEALFVMRKRELAWLDKHLDRALAGEGGVAFITGGPGRGKTALMDAFTRKALEAYPDLLIARGNCAAYAGVGDPYLPFRDIMAMLSGEVEARWTAGAISTGHARCLWNALPLILQSILEHGPGLIDIFVPGSAVLNRAMAAGPACAQLVQRLKGHLQLHSEGTSGAEQSYLFEQFSNVLRALSTPRPLLLFLDDLQWMDAASIGLLFHLVRRITADRSKILIIGAYRPEEIIRGQGGARHLLAKALSEFKRMFGDVWLSLSWADECEGRQFIDSVLDSEPNNLDQEFRAALFHRTGGHPLFTLELLRAMRDRGNLVAGADGRWQVGSQIEWQMIPARVEAVIAERIQRLEPELQELLTVASVEGELFTAQVVAQVLNLQERPLLRRLAQDLGKGYRLVRVWEAYQTGNKFVARYSFRHALFQEYLYQQLASDERQMLHEAVGAAIESVYVQDLDAWSVQLAQHFDRAGDYGRALHYCTCAAENAARVYAYDEAIGHYRRAIELARTAAASPRSRAHLYHGRGLAYETRGQFDLARADFECALDLSQTAVAPRTEWRTLLELGKLWSSRDYNRSRDYLQQALDLARSLNEPIILGSSLNRMGNWFANDENPTIALQYHREALQIFEELDDRPNLAKTLDLLGIASLLTGDSLANAAIYYNHAIQLFRELGNYPRLISSLIARALVATAPLILTVAPVDMPRDPFADLNEALQVARRIGSSPDEAWCAWAQALLNAVGGEFGRALEAGQHGLQLASSINHREWQVGNRYALGIVYNELLQPEQALPELEQALDLARELRSQYWVNHVSGALAKSHILLGKLATAQSCLDAVIAPGTAVDTAGKRYCWTRRAELALAMDDPAQALSICEYLVASAAGPTPGSVITILWLLSGEALAAMGRVTEAREMLEAGCENAAQRNELFLLWRFHAALAQVHQGNGCELAATEELAAARQLIEGLAATVADKAVSANFRCGAFDLLATI